MPQHRRREYFGNLKKGFEDSATLMRLATTLDNASLKPLHIEIQEGIFELDTIHKAVWNLNKGQLAALVSPAYNIFQHSEFIQTLVETFNSLNIPIKGNIVNLGNKVLGNILINKEYEISGDKFYLGFRITNSYDKTTCIKGEFYAVRLACQNGMLLANMGEIVLKEKHTTKRDVEQLIMKLIDNSARISPILNQLISESMESTIEGAMLNELWAKLGINKKWKEEIELELMKEYGDKGIYTKWELYNSLTHLITHHHKIGTTAFLKLERKSADLLNTPMPEIMVRK
jgi:hypothetical protein